MLKNIKNMSDDQFTISVWETQDANVNSDTKKVRTRRDGHVNWIFEFGQLGWFLYILDINNP